VPVPKRHASIEQAWPYFLGFGTPATLLTFFFPLFISLGLTACLFPFPLFLASRCLEAADEEVVISAKCIPKLPMFTLTRNVTESLAESLVALVLGKKSDYVAKLKDRRQQQQQQQQATGNKSSTSSSSSSSSTVDNAAQTSSTSTTTPTTNKASRKLASPPSHLKDDISRVRSMSQSQPLS
jgi:hypothetical protein